MNLSGTIREDKGLIMKFIFQVKGKVVSIHIKAVDQFPEYATQVPAFLI